jgi:hypothetical protein
MGGMGETLAALFIPLALLGLLVWAIHRWFRRYEPQGVVVESEIELEAVAPVIGTYHGDEIHEWVRYHGARYDFVFVASPGYQMRMQRDELFLPPGLVYRKV